MQNYNKVTTKMQETTCKVTTKLRNNHKETLHDHKKHCKEIQKKKNLQRDAKEPQRDTKQLQKGPKQPQRDTEQLLKYIKLPQTDMQNDHEYAKD